MGYLDNAGLARVWGKISAALDGKGTYSKPSSGIPKSDLASAVQTSLGKADTALQQHQSLAAYRTASAQDTIDAGKANSADLATVAFSGDYNDLSPSPLAWRPDFPGAPREAH